MAERPGWTGRRQRHPLYKPSNPARRGNSLAALSLCLPLVCPKTEWRREQNKRCGLFFSCANKLQKKSKSESLQGAYPKNLCAKQVAARGTWKSGLLFFGIKSLKKHSKRTDFVRFFPRSPAAWDILPTFSIKLPQNADYLLTFRRFYCKL